MRPLHIALLVVAGALGGAVVTRVMQTHPSPAQRAAVDVPAPAPQAPTPAAEAAAQPVTPPVVTQPGPSSVAHPEAEALPATAAPSEPQPRAVDEAESQPAPHRFRRTPPPPAHPRPLELGQTAPPPAAPRAAGEPQATPAPAAAMTPPPIAPAPEPAQAAPPPAPEPEPSPTVTLNAGTLIPVRLVDGLSSARNQPGDRFAATLDHELVVDGWVIAERGARVEGRVVATDHGSRVKGNADLSIELTRLHLSDGQSVAIQTDRFDRHAATDHQTDAAKIGGGAIVGAIIGAIAGGGKGAAIGAGAGAGAGAGDVMLTRKPAALPSETRLNFRLRAPVTLTEKRG